MLDACDSVTLVTEFSINFIFLHAREHGIYSFLNVIKKGVTSVTLSHLSYLYGITAAAETPLPVRGLRAYRYQQSQRRSDPL